MKLFPFLLAIVVVGGMLTIAHRLLLGKDSNQSKDKKFPRQIVFIVIVFFSLWILVLFLPINSNSRAELSAILGIIFSALVALSSTSILSNLMAGIVLRITQPFVIGDFIRVDTHFGRVSERGLLDTELQTEERTFVSIPNAYLLKTPISAINASGTVVSVNLSLGYDIHHKKIESLLLIAAEKAALEKPFVHILSLGDFSVTYRISGLLAETKHYVSTKSHLFACVLDELHSHNIEILSPNYMAQRPTDAEQKVIPQDLLTVAPATQHHAESVVFDKAEKAENIGRFRQQLHEDIQALSEQRKTSLGEDKPSIEKRISQKETLLEKLAQLEEDG